MKYFPQARFGAVLLCCATVAAPMAVAQTARTPGQVAQAGNQSGTIVARLSSRIDQLEGEIRRLTGQNEELNHRLRLLQAKVDKLTDEMALRPIAGGGAKPGRAADAAAAASNPPATGTAAGPAMAAPTLQPIPGAEKGVQVLGTVQAGPTGTAEQTARATPQPPPVANETPEQKYDRAHALIVKQREYGEAEQVLRTFIDANPKHALTPNAYYWLGRTFFVRGDFENAAFAFAEGFQKFPDSEKAPANLLNLGMSFSRLGKNREACTTYTRLLRKYRDAEDQVKRRVTRERNLAKCRRR